MFNFPELEEKVIKQWQEKDIFQKTLGKTSPKGEFVFFEGPPTANGKPGVHHVLARAFKDLIPRFKTMQGYHVDRKAGWDTHGLPVELQVEKELKISGKPDIEKYGIEAFNKKCKESVWQFKGDWEKLTERIGFWVDMNNPYITYTREYIESLWWVFKKINDRGLLYKGHKVVPHCPRCGTALSSHEVAQGYKLVKDNSVYLKFKLNPGQKIASEDIGDNTYILSWTTTPWTLPGNVALAVGEKLKYVEVTKDNEKFILVESLLEKVLPGAKINREFLGLDLVGLSYQPLFPEAITKDVPNYANAFKVYPANFVTTEDGTGVVHTAVMYGEDDYNLGLEVGLPQVHTVDENGNFLISGELNGKFVKDKEVEQVIVDYLKANNLLLGETVPYEHDYPFCWRCGTPLLYYAKDSWFIKMSSLRDQMLELNSKINWTPDHIKAGRFGEWLSGAKDWAISRERYWGTPLPIWVNDDGEILVVGNYQELANLSGRPEIAAPDFDPHRPFIDEVVIEKDGKTYKRVKEVVDCWFDSGSMPYAQHHVISDQDLEQLKAEGKFPAQYISEAIDQTRGWFYTLLAIATLLELEAPYQNVICLGHINDKFGLKMSKSKGNMVDPWDVINTWGADALRFHLYTLNQPGESKNFDIKNVEEVVKKNFMILFNVLNFYLPYKTKIQEDVFIDKINSVSNKLIISEFQFLVKKVTEYLEDYNIFAAARKISEFINELSTSYVRRSREAFKQADNQEFVQTLGYVLLNLAKIMAPFTPFIADDLYQKLGGRLESVHLEDWPKFKYFGDQDERYYHRGAGVRITRIIELAFAERKKLGFKVRQPLAKLKIYNSSIFPSNLSNANVIIDAYKKIIADEVNVKEIELINQGDMLKVELDTTMTPDLVNEGILRELVRQINNLRKNSNLSAKDKIDLGYQTDSTTLAEVLEKYSAELSSKVGAVKILANSIEEPLASEELTIGQENVTIFLKVV